MDVLVVSDIHLGASSRIAGSKGELCELLTARDYDMVVLAGDLFDLWVKPLHRIMEEDKEVLTVLRSRKQVVYIPGNHDEDLRGLSWMDKFRVVWPVYKYTDKGTSIAVAHGDTFDEYSDSLALKSEYWLADLADWFVQKMAGPGASIQRKIRHSLAKSKFAGEYDEEIAKKAADALETDVIVVGHTHMPGVRKVEGTTLVNSGAFGVDHMTWVEIVDGVVELHKKE